MPKICYIPRNFSEEALKWIRICNVVISDWQAQGYDLTLRQLYYQLVARGYVANHPKVYGKLGNIVNDARLAGLIDWDAIVDRTRNLRRVPHWDGAASLIGQAADDFRLDMWRSQRYRPEVWIEKDALIGVIAGMCERVDVPYFSCRGYTSQSEMWGAAQRLLVYERDGKTPMIFHLGDHDPSGKDMTRDITDRLSLFCGHPIQVVRLGLNINQIKKYNPPPNPAKMTDSRATDYVAEFGSSSWELDSLSPSVINALIRNAVSPLIDKPAWSKARKDVQYTKAMLRKTSANWPQVETFIGKVVVE